jgi:hypothetical protein
MFESGTVLALISLVERGGLRRSQLYGVLGSSPLPNVPNSYGTIVA